MTEEQLEKAKDISWEIRKCNKNIERANYTQSENVTIRETYLKVDGVDTSIDVPASLFRVIGKLILSEHQQKLIELENEFKNI